MIKCEGLTLIYDRGKEVETYALKNVGVTLDKNEMVVLVGPSGSGKSSLLYALSGIRKLTSGRIWYNNSDKHLEMYTEDEKAKFRRKELGFIFQRHFLVEYLNVIDNILVGVDEVTPQIRERAYQLMDRLNIKHLEKKRPWQLSGGQRQRVAIARALINSPKFIFADEPTASLDHESVDIVMNLLEEMKKDALIVIVTHDRNILQRADRILEMEDGVLTEDKRQ